MRVVEFERPCATSEFTMVRDAEPPNPKPGEVLIGVECAGVNFVDVMARRGDRLYAPTWPFRPGLEVAGTILAVGAADSAFSVGDRVAAFTRSGGLAEQVVADDALAVAVPDRVPFAAAAVAPLMMSTAMLLLTDVAHLGAGETVLMHAATGGVGAGVLQIARALGARLLVGTASTQDKAASAMEAGWDHVLVRDDHLSPTLADLAPEGFDVILDPLGTQTLNLDLDHAGANARVILFGNPQGQALGDLPAAGRLIGGNATVGGFSISALSRRAPRRVERALRRSVAMLSTGDLEVPITIVNGLDSVASIHDALSAGIGVGKYVVQVS